ncbi:MAG: hypothetical protein IPN92_06870 [Chromatiaceae bacterium]|nr:hypothetical protein [Chromatiaceae bacterium]
MLDLATIDPERQYRVTLNSRLVISDQVTLYPGWDCELRGDLVIQHAEAIDDATAV